MSWLSPGTAAHARGVHERRISSSLGRRCADHDARHYGRGYAALGELVRCDPGGDAGPPWMAALELVAVTLRAAYSQVIVRESGADGLDWLCGLHEGRPVDFGLPLTTTELARAALDSIDGAYGSRLLGEMRFDGPGLAKRHGLCSALSVVIPARDRPYGTVDVFLSSQRRLCDADLGFVRAVASVLGARLRPIASVGGSPIAPGTRRADPLLQAQEAERRRVAQELHDGLGQILTNINFRATRAMQALEAGEEEAGQGLLEAVPGLAREAIDETRRIAMALRPSVLDDLGILAAIAWHCREFRGAFPHIELEIGVEVSEQEVPEHLKTPIYRILQEALNNVAKHARAQRVRIGLIRSAGTLELAIHDDGVGLDPRRTALGAAPGGVGLTGMRDRAEAAGGSFSLRSRRPAGTRVEARWPLLPD